MNPNFKYSSKSWDRKSKLMEGEDDFFTGFILALIISGLILLIMASILIYLGAVAIGYTLIGIAGACVLVLVILVFKAFKK